MSAYIFSLDKSMPSSEALGNEVDSEKESVANKAFRGEVCRVAKEETLPNLAETKTINESFKI